MKRIILILILTLANSAIAQQYVAFSTTSVGRGPTIYNIPLLSHFQAATTKQIHNDANQQYVYTNATFNQILYTIITTGTIYGQSIQAVSGISSGLQFSLTANIYPMSTMTALAIMYLIYRDTYSATAAAQDFVWSNVQSLGGGIICSIGNGTTASSNTCMQMLYNPNATGYDIFLGSIPVKNDGKWHHIIHVYDRYASKMKQFIDGKKDTNIQSGAYVGLQEVDILKSSAPWSAPFDFHFGAYSGASTFQGRFDELKIVSTSSRSITDNECYQWYNDVTGRRGEQ